MVGESVGDSVGPGMVGGKDGEAEGLTFSVGEDDMLGDIVG